MSHPFLQIVLLPVLLPLEWVYRALVAFRLWAFGVGWFTTHHAQRPVVAVGNLSVGGTGKTPVVDWLARLAQQAGLRPVTLSRGYKSHSSGHLHRVQGASGGPVRPAWIGDEPALLAWRNPELGVYAGRDRVMAAELAQVLDNPDLIVLDDGYQHLRLHRDLNVLLVDGQRGLEGGRVLPRGRLREPIRNIRRADVVLVTKTTPQAAQALIEALQTQHGVTAPIFSCDYQPKGLRRLDGEEAQPVAWLSGKPTGLLSAIANPASFQAAITATGAIIEKVKSYPDHYAYPQTALEALEKEMAQQPDILWVTTEKDAVKLRGRLNHPERLWAVEMEVLPTPEANTFFDGFFQKLAEGKGKESGGA